MPTFRPLVPATLLALALVAAPILAATVVATDEVIVRPGDTLTAISSRYGVAVSTLVSINRIANPNRIDVGQRLQLSATTPPAPVPPPAPGAAAPSGSLVHIVRRGDNLWSIARFYGVSLSALVSANGIGDASRIHPGQQLTIPSAAPVAAPAPAPAPTLAPPSPAMSAGMAAVVAQRDAMRQVIAEEATNAGVPVALALAVAWQESGWRQDVVSSAGAVGIMQLMPGTAQWVGQSMLERAVDINDVRDNIRAGVRLLAHYLNRYGGNRDLVLAAYFQGQGAADRHGVYPVSRGYIASVNALVLLFGG
ncbi:MAG: LysM peptidoglycan-binding domain-containing protein [Chloroflexi bacterium]|nr:LysM peptidoglycan-binding domain-containing protein [Chloroflexota bacterium]